MANSESLIDKIRQYSSAQLENYNCLISVIFQIQSKLNSSNKGLLRQYSALVERFVHKIQFYHPCIESFLKMIPYENLPPDVKSTLALIESKREAFFLQSRKTGILFQEEMALMKRKMKTVHPSLKNKRFSPLSAKSQNINIIC